MTLLQKLLWVGSACAFLLVGVYLWYYQIWQAYYFPGRYEDAFAALANAIVASVTALLVTVGVHLLARRRRR